MNYIFLDTESTGSSTVWDQVLEIGMVWTDENLNIKEKWEMRSRIKDGIVPNLGACEVTGFSVQDLTQSNYSHLQMVEAMENTLKRWGNAYVFAYNGQNFDYPLIQKTLYKSLKPAYITNTNGKKHGDVLNIIRAAKLINPDVIETPMSDSGNPVFKLDRLMKHEGAHGAMADTLAMLEVAKKAYNKANSVWKSSLLTISKADTEDIITKQKLFCQLQWFYGRMRKYLVTHFIFHPVYLAWAQTWDLSNNPEDFFKLDDANLKQALTKSPKVLRTLKANKSEIILNHKHALTESPYKEIGVDELVRRASILHDNFEFKKRVTKILQDIHDEKTAKSITDDKILYPEEMLYAKGFPNNEDQTLMTFFHQFKWEDRVELIDKFKEERFSRLAEKLIYEEKPEILPESIKKRVKRDIAERIFSTDKQNWTTLPEFYRQIDEKRNKYENDEKKMKLLNDYDEFAQSIQKKYEIA